MPKKQSKRVQQKITQPQSEQAKPNKAKTHECIKSGLTDQQWPLVEKAPCIMPTALNRPNSVLPRKTYILPGSRVFTLQNFLTLRECNYYITQAQTIGYSSLAQEFEEDYRNNTRLSVNCPELAEQLWQILKPQFLPEDLDGVTPFGFGNQGEWRPVGLGAWFKFSEYKRNTYFKAHMDSSYVINSDLQSVYTVMIYLNDEFEGGITAFYDRDDVNGQYDPILLLEPRMGQAVVFNHDTRHAGLEVLKGVKYIMRTEVLFERISESPTAEHPSQLTAKQLFDKADALERKGQFVEACGYHLQAMELQVQRGSFEWQEERMGNAINRVKWPLAKETYSQMCQFLSLKEIGRLCCASKLHYLLSRDGGLWRKLYQRSWPGAYLLDSNTNAATMQAWYPRFKSTWLTNYKSCPVLFDFGSLMTKMAMIGHHAQEPVLPIDSPPIYSCIGMECRAHHSITGNGEDDMLRIGQDLQHCPVSQVHLPFIDGSVRDRFIRVLYQNKRIKAQNHPALIALPMHLSPLSVEGRAWQQSLKKVFLSSALQVPSVGFVDSAVAVIAESGLKSGICVSVGYKHVAVVGVRNCKREFCCIAPSHLQRVHALPSATRGGVYFGHSFREPDQLDTVWCFQNSAELGENGLPGFVFRALKKNVQFKDLLSAVILCGGLTTVEGFGHRFKTVLTSLLPQDEKAIFHLVPPNLNPLHVVIRGAAILAHTADTYTLFHGSEPRDPNTGATPLLSACYDNKLDEVKRLLKAGADPENTEKHFKQTALMIAASRGHAEVCRVLLEYGASISATDLDGWTALDIARNKGHLKVLAVLPRT